MRKKGGRKWGLPQFSCCARPTGISGGEEHWVPAPKAISGPQLSQNGGFGAEQGRPELSRDSHDRLVAYLGHGQLQQGVSGAVTAQTKHSAALEQRLNGLEIDDRSSSTDALANSVHLSTPSKGQSATSPHASLRASSSRPSSFDSHVGRKSQGSGLYFHPLEGSQHSVTAVIAEDEDFSTPQTQLLAAPGTPSPQQTPAAAGSPPDTSSPEAQKDRNMDSPQGSDRPRDVLEFSDESGQTTGTMAHLGLRAPLQPVHSPIQEESKPSSIISKGRGEDLNETERSTHSKQSVKKSSAADLARLAEISHLSSHPSSESGLRSTSRLSQFSSASIAESVEAMPLRLGRSQTLPLQPRRSTAQQSEHEEIVYTASAAPAPAPPKVVKQLMRRHTAVILMHESDDEDEEEREGGGGTESGTAFTGGSISGTITSSCRIRQSKHLQRRLSGVYEGHHVQLQKLRKQMGNPEGKSLNF